MVSASQLPLFFCVIYARPILRDPPPALDLESILSRAFTSAPPEITSDGRAALTPDHEVKLGVRARPQTTRRQRKQRNDGQMVAVTDIWWRQRRADVVDKRGLWMQVTFVWPSHPVRLPAASEFIFLTYARGRIGCPAIKAWHVRRHYG